MTNSKDILAKNKEHFKNELMMYLNQRLFEKKLITEDMYHGVKEFLLKQDGINI